MLNYLFSRSKIALTFIVMMLILGYNSFKLIPKEANPDVTIPIMYISMKLDGISAEDSEKSLIKPMEAELKSVTGVKKMNSSAYKGGGNVVLEFYAGYNLEKAYNDVKKEVDNINTLPNDAEKPKIFEVNVSEIPIIDVNIWGDADDRSMLEVAKDLKNKFRSIKSVLDVIISGERDELINLIVKPEIMELYQITPNQIELALKKANVILSSSEQENKKTGAFSIKLPNSSKKIDDILKTPIIVKGDSKILLKDIAVYNRGLSNTNVRTKLNGRNSINIEITKRSGTNLLETTKKIIQIIEQENVELNKKNINVSVSNDSSKDIERMLSELNNSIITSVLLIMVVVVAVLGLKNGLLVGFAIPFSFLSGIFIIALMGYSINVVVLFGLILSIGMLVDGAIVVSEYAQRKQDEGHSLKKSFIMSIHKMSKPIISATATTLVAFMPLLIWPGIIGEFMKFIPITLIIVLSCSALVALLFMPIIGVNINTFTKVMIFVSIIFISMQLFGLIGIVLGILISSIIVRSVRINLEKPNVPRVVKSITSINLKDYKKSASKFMVKYCDLLVLTINNPKKILFITLSGLILSWTLFGLFGKGTSFFPDSEPSTFKLNIHNPANLSLIEKEKLVNKVEKEIFKYNDENKYFTYINTSVGGRSGRRSIRNDTIGYITIELQDWSVRPSYKLIKQEILERIDHIKGIEIRSATPQKGPRTDKDVQLIITGSNRDDITKSVKKIKNHMEKKGIFIEIDSTINKTGIEFSYEPNMEKIQETGVDVRTISDLIKMLTQGKEVFDFRPDYTEEEVKVILKLPEKYNTITGIEELRVQTPNGAVPMMDLVTKKYSRKVSALHSENGKKIERISANLKIGYVANNEINSLLKEIDKNNLLVGKSDLYLSGDKEEENSSREFLSKAFVVAIFLMFIILLIQFNSFYLTFIILFSIILSTVGVFLGLFILQKPFSVVMSGLAVISLAGIVVNNNIVLVDTFLGLKETEREVKDAIIKTALVRFRPVLLTSSTTALGLLPTAMGVGIDFFNRTVSIDAPSSQIWILLSQNILFGLIFATILTLVITPAMLAVFYNKK